MYKMYVLDKLFFNMSVHFHHRARKRPKAVKDESFGINMMKVLNVKMPIFPRTIFIIKKMGKRD